MVLFADVEILRREHAREQTHKHTPVTREAFSTLALSGFGVTFSSVVADTLISTVLSKPSLWTSHRANGTLQKHNEAEEMNSNASLKKLEPNVQLSQLLNTTKYY